MATKFNYKIYNSQTKKYYSSSTKATWQRKVAVIDYVKDLNNRGYVDMDFVEVHVFPLEDATVVKALDFLEENREEIETNKLKRDKKVMEREAAYLKYKLEHLEKEKIKINEELEKTKNELSNR